MSAVSPQRMDGRACATETMDQEWWWWVEVETQGTWDKFRERHATPAEAINQAEVLMDGFPSEIIRVAGEAVARTAAIQQERAGSPIDEICGESRAPRP